MTEALPEMGAVAGVHTNQKLPGDIWSKGWGYDDVAARI